MIQANILKNMQYTQVLLKYSSQLIHTNDTIIISSINKKSSQAKNTTTITLSGDNTIHKTKRDDIKSNILLNTIYKHFFPRNYPHCVKPGYTHFTLHSFVNNTLINTMNFLSTQMLINQMGLSSMKAIKLSAGLNWVLKNGIGQISSFVYASNLSQAFERNTKQWRVLSALIGNSSLALEMLCNKLNKPYHILLLASLAQALKLCGIFGISSTQIGINHHFSTENNITDLQRKFYSQNQIGFCLGSLIGLIISLNVGWTPLSISKTLSLLSLMYIIVTYQSIKEINFDTLNYSRSKILFGNYIRNGSIIGLDEVNRLEGVLFGRIKIMKFGSSIEMIINSNKDKEYLREILKIFHNEKWVIYVNMKDLKSFRVMTSLSEKATSQDIIEAFYSSMRVVNLLNNHTKQLTQEVIIDVLKEEVSDNNSMKRKKLMQEIKLKGYDLNKNIILNRNTNHRYKYQYKAETRHQLDNNMKH